MVSYETVTPVMATGETCANDVREVAAHGRLIKKMHSGGI